MKFETYRPENLEFDVAHDGSPVPENLGIFETAEDATTHMEKNFSTTNQALTVNRFMDNFEKSELRKQVTDILENRMPSLEQDLRDACEAYNIAKKEKEDAAGMVTAYVNEAKAKSVEVKNGVKEMRLDELSTWKLPYKSKFYFFTYIDKQVRLVKISEMTELDKQELFSQGNINAEIFENGEITTQKGKKK